MLAVILQLHDEMRARGGVRSTVSTRNGLASRRGFGGVAYYRRCCLTCYLPLLHVIFRFGEDEVIVLNLAHLDADDDDGAGGGQEPSHAC